jgi:UPF0042 nucleotide-binding protein
VTEFLVISGLSGAGRSSAADNLEDLGWFVIDNLPAPLFSKILELTTGIGSPVDRIALVIGSGPYQEEVVHGIHSLRSTGSRVRVLFLDAATDTLVRRYEATRRRHPHTGTDRLGEAIEAERGVLEAVKAEADVVVDTSELNVHQLRARLVDLFGDEGPDRGMQVTVTSFGYKHGLPLDVDLVLDCRFLPNPHWVDELRPLTGLDPAVRDYVLGHEVAHEFLERLDQLLVMLLPAYVAEGKAYLTIAMGCTGGRHRSVIMAEELGVALKEHGFVATVTHRDIDK